jgi:hypothetical protein
MRQSAPEAHGWHEWLSYLKSHLENNVSKSFPLTGNGRQTEED